jgi:cytochrome c
LNNRYAELYLFKNRALKLKLRNLLMMVFIAAVAAGCGGAGDGQSGAPEAGEVATSAAAISESPGAGDADMGKRLYIFCQACHSINAGGMNKVGPNLHGIWGKASAQAGGFVYSESMADSGLVWDAATLDAWIQRPSELVPGTTMVFAGIQDAQQRADLLAYLKAAATAE